MKYKLLLAEDEYIERLAMKKIISMEYQDIYDIYEAENGIEAVEQAQKIQPEIIFMDIKMPGMTGIEAASKIRETNKEVKIIFVTAFDTFEYAKAAISIKAEEMLLKPVDMDEFLTQLKGWTEQLDEEQAAKNISMKSEEQYNALRRQLEMEFMETIQKFSCKEDDIAYYLGALGIAFNKAVAAEVDFTLTADFKKAGNVQKDKIVKEFVEKLYEITAENSQKIVIGRIDSCVKVLFMLDEEQATDIHTLHSYLERTAQYLGLKTDIRISNQVDSYMKLPSAVYQTGKHGSEEYNSIVAYPFEIEKMIVDDIGQGKFSEAKNALDEFSKELTKNFRGNEYRHMVLELYAVVKRAIIQISPDALMLHADKLVDEISDDNMLISFFTDLLDNVKKYTEQYSDRNKLLMQKVRAYVEEHYAEDISLDDMADMIGYSTYYFMKLVKEYFGMSFGDYLTSVRMNHAKKLLLSTNMPISEVGYSVGYNDANYFARVFKRQEKITPSEYKKQ